METRKQQRDRIADVLNGLGITTSAVFVPHKTKAGEQPELRWSVSVRRNGEEFHRTDYRQGAAHAPSYSHQFGAALTAAVVRECETGYTEQGTPVKPPKTADVVHRLLMDASGTDYGFEAWAAEFGYDDDSRKAERIYQSCLAVSLVLNRTFGADELPQLQEAFGYY